MEETQPPAWVERLIHWLGAPCRLAHSFVQKYGRSRSKQTSDITRRGVVPLLRLGLSSISLGSLPSVLVMNAYSIPEDSEDRLIGSRLREQNGDSFELLYRSYAPALRKFCRARLLKHSDVEDACHEALIRAHLASQRFREGARVWPWLATIAARVCIDFNRGTFRISLIEAEGRDSSICCAEPGFEVEQSMRRDILTEAMESLPHNYRLQVQMREIDGRSYSEIANALGVSMSVVKTTLMRARRSLRKELERVARKYDWPLPALVPQLWMTVRAGCRKTWNSVRQLVRSALLRLGPSDATCIVTPVINSLLTVAVALFSYSSVWQKPSDYGNSVATATARSSEILMSKPIVDRAQHGKEAEEAPNERGVVGRHYETEPVLIAPAESPDGERTVILIPGVAIDCGRAENRGVVMNTACSTLDHSP
jgi:RNA polymerase sigma-70 factor (ECF subfamily)